MFFLYYRDKDIEIEEYVNSGVKLSRPALKTQWFRREDFELLPPTTPVDNPLRCSSIETLTSSECNTVMEKVAASASAFTPGTTAEVETQTVPDTVDSTLGSQVAPGLFAPEPTQKRKLDKPPVKVSKKSSAQKKLMKL
jgi:hypothetical protein